MEDYSLGERKWRFPRNDYGSSCGLNDSGVETFKGSPVKSLAREICQNSIDAGNSDKPVIVEFKTFLIKKSAIPHFEQLEDAFKRAEEFWSVQENKKTVRFFKKALSTGSKEYIPCLRISDFNTTGLTGSDQEYNSSWCNLTKSSGVSDKAGSSGGSFGIGKNATFACSDLRTVFYSTLDKDGIEASQGVARLTSFKDASGMITQGTWFYGLERNIPVKEQIFLDTAFRRESGMTGTDIYVIGFTHDDEWLHQMVASVLDGFLYAINSEKLVVTVEGIEISRKNLPRLMEQYKEKFEEHADEYYKVLCADNTMSPEYTLDVENGMGRAHLRFLIAPGLWHRVAVVRGTGMKIMDRGYINNIIPFAGIMYIEGDALNSYLRSLENPQHTKWEIERADDKSKARKITKKLFDFMRESFNKQKQEGGGEPIDPAVGQYLADEEKGEQNSHEEGLTDEIEKVTLRPRIVRSVADSVPSATEQNSGIKAYQSAQEGEDESSSLPGEGSSDGGGKTGGDRHGGSAFGDGVGPHPVLHNQKIVYIKPTKKRAMCTDRKLGEYLISYTPSVSAENCFLEVFISAESEDYGATLVSASLIDGTPLKVEKNRVCGIKFEAGQPLKVNVKINYQDDYCSMEVNAYGNTL